MYTHTDQNNKARRVFRRHKLLKLFLPGLPWLIAFALVSAAVVYLIPALDHALWLLLLAGLPLYRILRLWLRWMSYSVTVIAGSNVLIERSGLLSVSERRVPVTEFATVEYSRPWWSALLGLNAGNVRVSAMDGALDARCIGELSSLQVFIESKGRTVPPKHPSALAVLLRLMCSALIALIALLCSIMRRLWLLLSRQIRLGRSSITALMNRACNRASPLTGHRRRSPPPHELCRNLGSSADMPAGLRSGEVRRARLIAFGDDASDAGYLYTGESFSPVAPSRVGLRAFCQQFLLTDNNWTYEHYRASDFSRRYYPWGISERVARLYLRQLREAFVLIPGPNGCQRERLSCRISSLKDIEHLIPYHGESLRKAA